MATPQMQAFNFNLAYSAFGPIQGVANQAGLVAAMTWERRLLHKAKQVLLMQLAFVRQNQHLNQLTDQLIAALAEDSFHHAVDEANFPKSIAQQNTDKCCADNAREIWRTDC